MSSLLERLAAHIPGYTGYADRERRRETDQALRHAIARRLAERKLAVDRLLAEAAPSMRFDALEPLESLKRRLECLADHLRLAPAGYAGLFDAQQVDVGELDRLVEHDGRLRDVVEELCASIDGLSLAAGEGLARAERGMTTLEDACLRRDELLKGVG